MSIKSETGPVGMDIQKELLSPDKAIGGKEAYLSQLGTAIEQTSLTDPIFCKGLKIKPLETCFDSKPWLKSQFADASLGFTKEMMDLIESRKAPKPKDVVDRSPEQDKLSEIARMAEDSYIDFKKEGKEFMPVANNVNSEMYGRLCEYAYDIRSGKKGSDMAKLIMQNGSAMNLKDEDRYLYQYIMANLDIRDNLLASGRNDGMSEPLTVMALELRINKLLNPIGDFAMKILKSIKSGAEYTIEGIAGTISKTDWALRNTSSMAMDSLLGIFKDGKKEIIDSGKEFLSKYEIIGDPVSDNTTGLQAMLVQRKGDGTAEKTLIIRGTDEWKDIVGSDKQIGLKYLPDQLKPLITFFENIKRQFPNDKINIVGHSLGGALAQLLSVIYKQENIIGEVHTFNAPGIMNLKTEFEKGNDRSDESIKIALERFKIGQKHDYDFVYNTVNEDEIGNHGEHVGKDSKPLPGKLHFMRNMREKIETMKTEEFMKYFKEFYINKPDFIW